VQDDDYDATIVAPYRAAAKTASSPLRPLATAALGLAALVVIGAAGYFLYGYDKRAAGDNAAALTAPAKPATPLRSEADILAQVSDSVIVSRFAPNPNILVLDFPNLKAQGEAFNRMAAYIEKRGVSRERVLNDRELAEAIAEDNSTVETYYYGHDYRQADVVRFFAAADGQNLKLSRAEEDLRGILGREGLLTGNADEAVITIPREGSDPFVDAAGRASLLRHELSHGEYFTHPAYAAYVLQFWNTVMTDADRAAFQGFLTRQGYDPDNKDLMANETQAHLMNTTDPRYFNAPACGLPVARINALRTAFLEKMSAGWLRDAMLSVRDKLP
jgi:hypothetical protein